MSIPIAGAAYLTQAEFTAYVTTLNPHARYLAVIPIYYELGPAYGIVADGALMQSAKETNYGRYGGVVSPEFHNWAGIKTMTGGSNTDPKAHAKFPDDRTGIHAHYQHLAAYAGLKLPAGTTLVDPRYGLVKQGSATTFAALGGLYAPSRSYGTDIEAMIAAARKTGGGTTQMAQTDDPAADWQPSSNFDAGRGGVTIDRIILHTTEGGYLGSLHWLQGQPASSNTDSSAHYIVDANGGQLAQLVREADTAWAAGVYSWNQRSINIEQEGYAAKGGFSDGLYQTVGALVGRIARRHGIPLDRQHVIGHMDVPDPYNPSLKGGVDHHGDPGKFYSFDRVLQIAGNVTTDTTQSEADQPRWFPETRHYISHGFKAFYESHSDALMLFGYPLSEEFSDASGTVVQWFERARFEWHPGSNQNPWDVLLGRLGADAMANDRNQFPAAFADAEPPK